LNTKLKGRHFDTNEAIEEEWQAVLNTFAEFDFQEAFNKGGKAGKGAYARKETTSRAMVASRPEFRFD
jgi:hypothetical protein